MPFPAFLGHDFCQTQNTRNACMTPEALPGSHRLGSRTQIQSRESVAAATFFLRFFFFFRFCFFSKNRDNLLRLIGSVALEFRATRPPPSVQRSGQPCMEGSTGKNWSSDSVWSPRCERKAQDSSEGAPFGSTEKPKGRFVNNA